MSLTDIFRMALQNLWQRRLRTALNLIGIVIGSIVLLMTSAGTRGVREAIHALIDANEFARQILIHPNYRPEVTPPESALVVSGQMSDARRERIRESLAGKWRTEYFRDQHQLFPIWQITPAQLESLRDVEHVVSVIPHQYISCRASQRGTELISSIAPADLQSSLLRQRLLAGEMLANGDQEGVLIDEFLAYQLGFRSDSQLPEIVDQPLTVSVSTDGTAVSIFRLLNNLQGAAFGDELGQLTEYMAAGRQLVADLDSTSLSDSQKKLVRETLSKSFLPSEQNPTLVMTRRLVIRGVLRMGLDSNPLAMLQDHLNIDHAGLFVVPDLVRSIATAQPEFKGFNRAAIVVEKTQHLGAVCKELDRLHFSHFSALWLIENIDVQIDQAKWVMYGIAASILLTAAIGISNTLVISVMERTPEFGILKSVGAKDSQLVLLMLCEGAVLGISGAMIAICAAIIGALLGNGILLKVIEVRYNTGLAGDVFHFSILSMLFVILSSTTICIIASILPAWRAARLDPVVAMRRT